MLNQDALNSGTTFITVPGYPNTVYAMGFGAPASGQTYPALYLVGTLTSDPNCVAVGDVAAGFSTSTKCIYRSVDGSNAFVRINDYDHQYSNANIIVTTRASSAGFTSLLRDETSSKDIPQIKYGCSWR